MFLHTCNITSPFGWLSNVNRSEGEPRGALPLGLFPELMKQWSHPLQAGNYSQYFYKKITYNRKLLVYNVHSVS